MSWGWVMLRRSGLREPAPQFAVDADEPFGGGVGEVGLRLLGGERGGQVEGHLLAQLDAPLVEGVDAPDGALDEDDVLVEGDELAQGRRGEFGGEDGAAGPVARRGLAG